jgi:HlyD family secretion protein
MRTGPGRWFLVLALLLVAGLVNGCGLGEQDQAAVELEVAPVERGSLTSSITAVGTVRAGTEVILSFEAPGRVSRVAVQEGERVEEGQLLAQLDQADLALQIRSAEAALASAQAQLDAVQEGPRPEEISAAEGQVAAAQAALDQAIAQRDQLLNGATEAEIAAARAAVKSAKASYDRVKAGPSPEERAQAKAALDSAKASLQQAQAAYDRVAGREDVGMTPESLALQVATIEMERAQANYDALLSHPTAADLAAAEAQVAQAEAHLAQLEASVEPQLRVATAAVDAAQAQRDIAQAQLDLLRTGARSSEIAAAEAQVEQAQVAVDSARLALRRANLEAPVEGTVANIAIETGESVSPQMPAMTLVGDSQFSIEAEVDEADIGWIAVGQEVKITFDAFPDQELAGRVLAIAPLASVDLGIVSYRVTIESQETNLPLRTGMTANTEIVKERREDVLLVPNLAIALDAETGRKYVDRQTATGLERVEIETGLTTDVYSEVLSGLQEGDLVVVSSLSDRDQFRELMDATFSGGSRE